MKKVVWYMLVLVLLWLGGCITLGESHPCGVTEDGRKVECGTGYKCLHGWCVPQDWSLSDAGGRDGLQGGSERSAESLGGDAFSGDKVNAHEGDEVAKDTSFSELAQSETYVDGGGTDTKQCAETCRLGEAKPCYGGQSGCTAGGTCKGVCQQGQQFCYLENGCPTWSTCFDEITPVVEVCNNKDDDCDGQTDEALKRSCYDGKKGTEGQGICKAGEQSCSAGKWGACTGQQLPKTEVCNKTDDDCDSQVDEGCDCAPGTTQACGVSDVGECKKGLQTCSILGQWGICTGEKPAGTESCNNKDDDCDGQTDEELKRPCYEGKSGTEGKGICKGGEQSCSAGKWGACTGQQLPEQEKCDGLDNDCNGQIDEADPILNRGCTSLGVGYCKPGLWKCVNKKMTCTIVRTPQTEACGNNVDDDCDGKTDEGCVTTLAGNGSRASIDGSGSQASLHGPIGLAFDSKGNLYVAEYFGHRIRKVDTTGNVTTFAGSGAQGFKNGPSTQAQFSFPYDVVSDGKGNLYVADGGNHRIRKIDVSGNVTTFAGSGIGVKDGPALQAGFSLPSGLAFDMSGNLYVAERGNHRIRKIDTSGNVTTVAGSGVAGFKDGLTTQAQFNEPNHMVFDSHGNLYIADYKNHRIRKMDLQGNVTTFAGTGVPGFKDGGATQAQFNRPSGVAFDGGGDLYVTDAFNCKIRRISVLGIVSTFAGANSCGFRDDLLLKAFLDDFVGIVFGSKGNLYVAGFKNNRIRRVTFP